MLLENRVLWGSIAATESKDMPLQEVLVGSKDVRLLAGNSGRGQRGVTTLRASLATTVEYTKAAALLDICSVTSSSYEFEFLAAVLKSAGQDYYCFFAPFRRMLGAVLQRVNASLKGTGCRWFRVGIMPTVVAFRRRHRAIEASKSGIQLCGIDLHILAAQGQEEIVFVGLNPVHSRAFAALTDVGEGFTLAPISATFCVGAEPSSRRRAASYLTVDRNGVFNAAVGGTTDFLGDLLALVSLFEDLGTLDASVDRPVYRSRNAHKRAILDSISA